MYVCVYMCVYACTHHIQALTHIVKVKKEAPIVELTLLENTFPTYRNTIEVFPTPAKYK